MAALKRYRLPYKIRKVCGDELATNMLIFHDDCFCIVQWIGIPTNSTIMEICLKPLYGRQKTIKIGIKVEFDSFGYLLQPYK